MADRQRSLWSTDRNRWEELGVMLQMIEMGYVDTARKVTGDTAHIDCEGIKDGRKIFFEVKVRDAHSRKWPTIRVSLGKYEHAQKLMDQGYHVRYIVQWLDRCISYAFTTWDLPVHDGRRHDRPGVISPCVDMPKRAVRELWVGSIILRHVDIMAPTGSQSLEPELGKPAERR